MSGILIDSIAYNFMLSYQYAKEPFIYYDWISRDFFKYVYDNADKRYWDKPGGTGTVERKYYIKDDAKFAYDKACEAIEDGENGFSFCWHNEWREIYGSRFPNA